MAPARPRRRSGARLVGSRSRLNRSSSRRAISWTDSDFTRAAASSIASGSPSRARQTSSTTAASSSSRTNWCRMLRRPAGEQRRRVGQRQRLERVDDLAVQPERDLAGREHRSAAARRPAAGLTSSADRRRPRARSCRAAAPTRPPRSGRRACRSPPATCSVSATSARDRRRRVRRVQPDQPGAARGHERRGRPRSPYGSCRRRRGPTTVTSRCSRTRPAQGGQLVGTPDQLGRRARAGCPTEPASDGPRRRSPPQRRALLQDLLLEAAQRRARVDAELVDQQLRAPGRTPPARRPADRRGRAR